MYIFYLVLFSTYLLLNLKNSDGYHLHRPFSLFLSRSKQSTFQLLDSSFEPVDLDVGDFENVKIKKVGQVTELLGKYRVEATIKSKEFNGYLNEYKEEMKRRKVVFPGFRPGKLPPYVMGDVRRYLVCYGLELLIGQLCNINGLEMRSETGEPVAFGQDSYYEQIIQKDFRGYGYTEQRDNWKEGTDLSFVAEFYAMKDETSVESEKTDILDVEGSVVTETIDKSVKVE